MFEAEQSTKWARQGEVGIHAWGEENALRLLVCFLEIVQSDEPIPDLCGAQIYEMDLRKKEIPTETTAA